MKAILTDKQMTEFADKIRKEMPYSAKNGCADIYRATLNGRWVVDILKGYAGKYLPKIMTLPEIGERIMAIYDELSYLADECYDLYDKTEDKHTKAVAEHLHYELTSHASKLCNLAPSIEGDDEEDPDIEDALCEWWDELDSVDKSEIADIPMPTGTDARGEEMADFEERADLWWNALTYSRKKEVCEEWCEQIGDELPWRDKEDEDEREMPWDYK